MLIREAVDVQVLELRGEGRCVLREVLLGHHIDEHATRQERALPMPEKFELEAFTIGLIVGRIEVAQRKATSGFRLQAVADEDVIELQHGLLERAPVPARRRAWCCARTHA